MLSIDHTIESWVRRWRERVDLPLRVRWHTDAGAADEAPFWDLGDFEQPRVTIIVRDAAALPALLAPSLDTLGEAYVEGRIDVEGAIEDVIAMAQTLVAASAESKSRTPGALSRWVRALTTHTRRSDREAIQYHYDVSNDFYARWLDPAMVYSCAYFEQGDEDLATAQRKKIDHILTKVRLQPGQTLLDIGCGWGALVMRAAQAYGARCVGITLSQAQYDLARERVAAAGLADRVEIRLQDYRDVDGTYDCITSVGMFEHVGLRHLPEYFRIIHDRLAPGGWCLNHGITTTDPHDGETPHGGGRFIDRYVFPHGELPHIGTVLRTLQEGGLEPFDVESLRRHYALTLTHWSRAFEAQRDALRAMVPEKTWRIWRVYLAGCAWAFEHDQVSIFQVLCRRAGRSAQELPWSRRWIYEGQTRGPSG
ncbi:cyclopropane-fatty-acyl-phospholipid synthase family protein [Tepidimonas sp.]|uniref:cyclopropane-fatty-acyl-phospholipid synthase family protein n=1 Tax=Tepidimonas sp. TaxID=2002775 RepID=UPI0028CED236|nr:cyclopropane-fatty-acyl-phospholipid synthase family protein [Tepidimonas sp.]MDT7929438.1 cyclopropane-fatty-acyl-phospholipid synthase family protein [Tepidimonas sp.]